MEISRLGKKRSQVTFGPISITVRSWWVGTGWSCIWPLILIARVHLIGSGSTSAASRARFERRFEAVAAGGRADHILPAAARAAGKWADTHNFRGGQVWVEVLDERITNAGVNPVGSFR